MRPNSHQLAMRDPALASIMGAIPSDFGASSRSQVARRATRATRATAAFGDFGFGFGAEEHALAAPPPPMAHAAHPMHRGGHGHGMLNEEALRALRHHEMMQHHTMNRALLLDPNRYSTLKVQGYSFSLATNTGGAGINNLVIGTPNSFNVTLQPNSKIRPKRMVANVNSPGMILLTGVQVANVNVLIGSTDDASIYAANSFGLENEFPTLDTSTRATMTGTYTGYAPPGYAPGFPYVFVLTFQGPAALAGNG